MTAIVSLPITPLIPVGVTGPANKSLDPPANNRVDNNGFKIIDLATTLTDDDKKIVKAATAQEIGRSNEVNVLAVNIAISRSDGTLKGPVTASFLQHIAQDIQIGSTVIDKAMSHIRNSTASETTKPGVNFFS